MAGRHIYHLESVTLTEDSARRVSDLYTNFTSLLIEYGYEHIRENLELSEDIECLEKVMNALEIMTKRKEEVNKAQEQKKMEEQAKFEEQLAIDKQREVSRLGRPLVSDELADLMHVQMRRLSYDRYLEILKRSENSTNPKMPDQISIPQQHDEDVHNNSVNVEGFNLVI